MEKYFSKTHEWVAVQNEIAVVGITAFGVKEFGSEITGVSLPSKRSDLIAGDLAATIESISSTSEVYSPISGTVKDLNRTVRDNPEMIAMAPEKQGWLFKLENIDETELDDLMDAAAYKAYLETLG